VEGVLSSGIGGVFPGGGLVTTALYCVGTIVL